MSKLHQSGESKEEHTTVEARRGSRRLMVKSMIMVSLLCQRILRFGIIPYICTQKALSFADSILVLGKSVLSDHGHYHLRSFSTERQVLPRTSRTGLAVWVQIAACSTYSI